MAAVTNDHTLSGLNNTNWLSYSGGHKSWSGRHVEIKVSQGCVFLSGGSRGEPVSCPLKIVGGIQTLFTCAVPDVYRMTLHESLSLSPLLSFVYPCLSFLPTPIETEWFIFCFIHLIESCMFRTG